MSVLNSLKRCIRQITKNNEEDIHTQYISSSTFVHALIQTVNVIKVIILCKANDLLFLKYKRTNCLILFNIFIQLTYHNSYFK